MDQPEWMEYLNQFEKLDASYFSKIPKITNKYCIILETRTDPILINVIKNFMYLLQNEGWGLIIFHGIDNNHFIKTALNGWSNVHYVNMWIHSMDQNDYSNELCCSAFWERLQIKRCEHVLIFQMDTILLKPNVNEFLKYDYIGAAWCLKWLGVLECGNGGLSMRNVDTMKMITETCPRDANTSYGWRYLENEDIYFSYWLHKFVNRYNIKIPDIETCGRFSVETRFHEDPCGMHQPHLDKFPSRESFVKLLEKRFVF
jgi:hypothetical protein